MIKKIKHTILNTIQQLLDNMIFLTIGYLGLSFGLLLILYLSVQPVIITILIILSLVYAVCYFPTVALFGSAVNKITAHSEIKRLYISKAYLH